MTVLTMQSPCIIRRDMLITVCMAFDTPLPLDRLAMRTKQSVLFCRQPAPPLPLEWHQHDKNSTVMAPFTVHVQQTRHPQHACHPSPFL